MNQVVRNIAGYELADWRRRINDLYSQIRNFDDPVQAWRHWHEVRSKLFRTHPMSPVPVLQRASFVEIPVFEYDAGLRFEVALEPVQKKQVTDVIGKDGTLSYSSIARTVGLEPALGAELTVYWIEGYGGGLFMPFRDASSTHETFGGGRYVIDAIKGADLGTARGGEMIIDFNFSYSPSCAWNNDYVCPLSPVENTLACAVRAGEKTP